MPMLLSSRNLNTSSGSLQVSAWGETKKKKKEMNRRRTWIRVNFWMESVEINILLRRETRSWGKNHVVECEWLTIHTFKGYMLELQTVAELVDTHANTHTSSNKSYSLRAHVLTNAQISMFLCIERLKKTWWCSHYFSSFTQKSIVILDLDDNKQTNKQTNK